MAVVRITDTVKGNILTQIRSAIDSGGAGGTIKIYSGSIPANPTIAPTPGIQDILGTLTFAYPECGTIAAGVLTMNPITQDNSADANGTASWARIANSSGTTVMDVNVSVQGAGGAIQLNTTNIVAGGPIIVNSFQINVP